MVMRRGFENFMGLVGGFEFEGGEWCLRLCFLDF